MFTFQFVEGFSRLGFRNDPYLQRKLKFIYQQYLVKYPVVSISQYLLTVSKPNRNCVIPFGSLSGGIPFLLVCSYSCAINKKVLPRERKRHTTRCVSSTPSAVLSRGGGGVPHPWLGGGTPSLD